MASGTHGKTSLVMPLGDAVAPYLPWVMPDIRGDEMTLGFEERTGAPFPFWPPEMMQDGRIEAMTILAMAKRNKGKTGTTKQFATRASALGVDGNHLTIGGTDRRSMMGVPEYAHWLQDVYKCDEADLSQGFNILHPDFGFTPAELQEITLGSLTRLNEGEALGSGMQWAVSVALEKMHNQRFADAVASLDLLSGFLLTLSTDDITAYHPQWQNGLLSQQQLQKLPEVVRAELAKPPNFDNAAFQNDARQAAQLLLTQLSSQFGRFVTNTTLSLPEQMAQRVAFVNLAGLSPSDEDYVQWFLQVLKRSALRRKDWRFIKNLEIHEENPRSWRMRSYGIGMLDYLAEIRSYPSMVWMNSHGEMPYHAVGDAGSMERQRAISMFDYVSIWMYGSLPKREVELAADRHSLSKADMHKLQHNTRPGEWLVIIGDEPPVWIHAARTAIESGFTESNAALESMNVANSDREER